MTAKAGNFTQYLDDGLLPYRQVEKRVNTGSNVALVLASHAPSPGIYYEPIDDMVVSVVLQSNRSSVVRDVGFGRTNFKEMAGSILVTPPRTGSYWYFESTPQILHMGFPRKMLRDYSDDHGVLARRLSAGPLHDPLIQALATRLWAASREDSAIFNLFCENALTTLLATLFTHGERAGSAERRDTAPLPGWRLRKAKDIMLAHLSTGIATPDVARHVGLSTHHFLRAFAAATGQTPHQWMLTQRIDRAMALLRKGDLSITEIALELGFSSPSHFATSFRRIAGVTPRQWRDRYS